MSTKQNGLDNKDLLVTYIKCEDNTNDDIIYDKSTELHDKNDRYSNALSTSTIITPSLTSTYKGKIEVTSKGRRKIFDGVRWQILCKRPDCRKQTNKKSLCITHYKEEYESNNRLSWSNNTSPFQFSAYQRRQSFDNAKSRIENEDQNNTISTTNMSDNDEQMLINSNDKSAVSEGQIEYMPNGRRFVFKNSKWLPLCKYDSLCHNSAKYDLLCIKHFELMQQKRQEVLKYHSNDNQRLRSSIFSNDIIKRLKTNNDFQISSSGITEQFNINGHGNNYLTNKKINGDFALLTSKLVGHETGVSMRKNLNSVSSEKSLLNKQQSELKSDQWVQTDLTIPLCCVIHNEDHSIYSSCEKNKSVSSSLFHDTKPERKCFDRNFST